MSGLYLTVMLPKQDCYLQVRNVSVQALSWCEPPGNQHSGLFGVCSVQDVIYNALDITSRKSLACVGRLTGWDREVDHVRTWCFITQPTIK